MIKLLNDAVLCAGVLGLSRRMKWERGHESRIGKNLEGGGCHLLQGIISEFVCETGENHKNPEDGL